MEENIEIKKKKKWIVPIGVGILLMLVIVVVVVWALVAPALGKNSKYNENVNLGNKYLSEMDYESAIAYYEEAIKIDDSKADAYLELINLFDKLEMYDDAYELALLAYEKTGDELFVSKINEFDLVKIHTRLMNKYSEELEYERVIEECNRLIELGVENEDVFDNLIDAYININDFESAHNIAEMAYSKLGVSKYLETIEMLESGNVFDSLGRSHKETYYNSNGEYIFALTYEYGKNDEITVNRLDKEGNVAFSTLECEYDDKGRIIKNVNGHTISDDGGELLISYIKYDDNNPSMKHVRQVYEDGSVSEEYISEEDEEGNTICTLFDAEGRIKSKEVRKWTTIYDDGWHDYNLYRYNAEDVLQSYSVHKREGNKSIQEDYDASGKIVSISITEWIYDENGELIKTIETDGITGEVKYVIDNK